VAAVPSAAAAAATAGLVASAPAGSLSTSGSLALAGAGGLKALGVLKQEEMPAELRISAARAERKKKTEVCVKVFNPGHTRLMQFVTICDTS
jgi:hypothetical protein